MTIPHLFRFTFRSSTLAAVFSLVALGGCRSTHVDDATLTKNVQAALAADTSIANQSVQPTVVNGVVTLSGNVSDDTARTVVAQDAAKVKGVQEVVNATTIQGLALAPTITNPAAPTAPRTATSQERQEIANNQPLPPPPASAPAPPAPAYHDISVPAGTGISVRINQTLDSGSTPEGATFSGIVTRNVIANGEIAIPAGSGVSGQVVSVHDAGHFKGNSLLSVVLTGINRRGEHISITTDPYTLEGKGRGANTAEKVGGGAVIGAVLGGILGGGKGAAIGAGVGAGGGAAINGATRGQQVQIASESVVRFRFANRFTARSYGPSDDPDDNNGDGLQRR